MRLYRHDCGRCKYLGPSKVEGSRVEWYVCRDFGVIPTLIGRRSSEGADCWSMSLKSVREFDPLIPMHTAALLKVDAAIDALRPKLLYPVNRWFAHWSWTRWKVRIRWEDYAHTIVLGPLAFQKRIRPEEPDAP